MIKKYVTLLDRNANVWIFQSILGTKDSELRPGLKYLGVNIKH